MGKYSPHNMRQPITDQCKLYGVSRATVYRRMAQGMNLHTALCVTRESKSPQVTIGHHTMTAVEWCKDLGIERETLRRTSKDKGTTMVQTILHYAIKRYREGIYQGCLEPLIAKQAKRIYTWDNLATDLSEKLTCNSDV